MTGQQAAVEAFRTDCSAASPASLRCPSDSPLDKLLKDCKDTSKCIFSSCGLAAGYLEQHKLAKHALEKECGTLPSTVPKSCGGTCKNEHGLKHHAQTFCGRAGAKADTQSSDHDDDAQETFEKGRQLLHDYLNRTIPVEVQLAQKDSQLRGQAAERKAAVRKLEVEKSGLAQRNVQLQTELKRHEHDMEESRVRHARVVEALENEFREVATHEAVRSSEQARRPRIQACLGRPVDTAVSLSSLRPRCRLASSSSSSSGSRRTSGRS